MNFGYLMNSKFDTGVKKYGGQGLKNSFSQHRNVVAVHPVAFYTAPEENNPFVEECSEQQASSMQSKSNNRALQEIDKNSFSLKKGNMISGKEKRRTRDDCSSRRDLPGKVTLNSNIDRDENAMPGKKQCSRSRSPLNGSSNDVLEPIPETENAAENRAIEELTAIFARGILSHREFLQSSIELGNFSTTQESVSMNYPSERCKDWMTDLGFKCDQRAIICSSGFDTIREVIRRRELASTSRPNSPWEVEVEVGTDMPGTDPASLSLSNSVSMPGLCSRSTSSDSLQCNNAFSALSLNLVALNNHIKIHPGSESGNSNGNGNGNRNVTNNIQRRRSSTPCLPTPKHSGTPHHITSSSSLQTSPIEDDILEEDNIYNINDRNIINKDIIKIRNKDLNTLSVFTNNFVMRPRILSPSDDSQSEPPTPFSVGSTSSDSFCAFSPDACHNNSNSSNSNNNNTNTTNNSVLKRFKKKATLIGLDGIGSSMSSERNSTSNNNNSNNNKYQDRSGGICSSFSIDSEDNCRKENKKEDNEISQEFDRLVLNKHITTAAAAAASSSLLSSSSSERSSTDESTPPPKSQSALTVVRLPSTAEVEEDEEEDELQEQEYNNTNTNNNDNDDTIDDNSETKTEEDENEIKDGRTVSFGPDVEVPFVNSSPIVQRGRSITVPSRRLDASSLSSHFRIQRNVDTSSSRISGGFNSCGLTSSSNMAAVLSPHQMVRAVGSRKRRDDSDDPRRIKRGLTCPALPFSSDYRNNTFNNNNNNNNTAFTPFNTATSTSTTATGSAAGGQTPNHYVCRTSNLQTPVRLASDDWGISERADLIMMTYLARIVVEVKSESLSSKQDSNDNSSSHPLILKLNSYASSDSQSGSIDDIGDNPVVTTTSSTAANGAIIFRTTSASTVAIVKMSNNMNSINNIPLARCRSTGELEPTCNLESRYNFGTTISSGSSSSNANGIGGGSSSSISDRRITSTSTSSLSSSSSDLDFLSRANRSKNEEGGKRTGVSRTGNRPSSFNVTRGSSMFDLANSPFRPSSPHNLSPSTSPPIACRISMDNIMPTSNESNGSKDINSTGNNNSNNTSMSNLRRSISCGILGSENNLEIAATRAGAGAGIGAGRVSLATASAFAMKMSNLNRSSSTNTSSSKRMKQSIGKWKRISDSLAKKNLSKAFSHTFADKYHAHSHTNSYNNMQQHQQVCGVEGKEGKAGCNKLQQHRHGVQGYSSSSNSSRRMSTQFTCKELIPKDDEILGDVAEEGEEDSNKNSDNNVVIMDDEYPSDIIDEIGNLSTNSHTLNHRQLNVEGLDAISFAGVVIGGSYQQWWDGSMPVIIPPISSAKRVIGVKFADDGSLELELYIPKDNVPKVINLGLHWKWIPASPTGYLVCKSAFVTKNKLTSASSTATSTSNYGMRRRQPASCVTHLSLDSSSRKTCYFLPRHPNDWILSTVLESTTNNINNIDGDKEQDRSSSSSSSLLILSRHRSDDHLCIMNQSNTSSTCSMTMAMGIVDRLENSCDTHENEHDIDNDHDNHIGSVSFNNLSPIKTDDSMKARMILEYDNNNNHDNSGEMLLQHQHEGEGGMILDSDLNDDSLVSGIAMSTDLDDMCTGTAGDNVIGNNSSSDDIFFDKMNSNSSIIVEEDNDNDNDSDINMTFLIQQNIACLVLDYIFDPMQAFKTITGTDSINYVSSSSSSSVYFVCKSWALAYSKLFIKDFVMNKCDSNPMKYTTFKKFMLKFNWGKFLGQGACKDVYCIQNSDIGINNNNTTSTTTNNSSTSFGSNINNEHCNQNRNENENELEAISVMDIKDLRNRDMELALSRELEISMICSSLFKLNICPNFVQIHSVFQTEYGVPNSLWNTKNRLKPSKRGDQLPVPATTQLNKSLYQYTRMEYCRGGDLEEYLHHNIIGIDMIRSLFFQLCYAMYCSREQMSLRHYDVKLLNVLITNASSISPQNKDAPLPGSLSKTSHSSSSTSSFPSYFGVGEHMFHIPMDSQEASLVKLTDFGTSLMGDEELGCPITQQQFTTLENTPPEFLILGSAARQCYSADTFCLGLSFFHFLTGGAPYEEHLQNIHCPLYLAHRLVYFWNPKKDLNSPYHIISDVLQSVDWTEEDNEEEDVKDLKPNNNKNNKNKNEKQQSIQRYIGKEAVFCDTIYRYIVLFGLPGDELSSESESQSESWEDNPILQTLSHSLHGTQMPKNARRIRNLPYSSKTDKMNCMAQYEEDRLLWSLGCGSHGTMKKVRSNLESLSPNGDGATLLLKSMVHFNPARRCTLYEALLSPMFTSLRVNSSLVYEEVDRNTAVAYTHYFRNSEKGSAANNNNNHNNHLYYPLPIL